MILEEETFKHFGYYPKTLKRCSSKKKILASCDECGKIRITTKNTYRDLCRHCSQMGEKNPFCGKQHTEETKEKMRQNHVGMKGMHHTEETKKKMSKKCVGMIGKHHSDETKQKISESHKERFKNPENHPMYGKHHSDETRKKMSGNHYDIAGKNHPNWKGGTSFEPYCIKFNDEFKERAREFWSRKCVLCDKSEKENGRKLDVHLVTYNKDTCCDGSIPLFVTLCASCHLKTHHREIYWCNIFKEMIYNNNSGGKCFYTKEEKNKVKHSPTKYTNFEEKGGN